MKKKLWLFIDIDNCIMPTIFNNTKDFYKNNWEKINTIIGAYQKGRDFKLYGEFIDFYRRIISYENYDITDITFVTGRQKNVYGWLTDVQLKVLEDFHWFTINYFYNHSKHTFELYKSFKIHAILNDIKYTDFQGEIFIFDDLPFEKELREALDKPFNFYLIKNKEDWNKL